MDKNTILAIVLSGVVLVGWMIVEQVYFLPKQQAAQAQRLEQQQIAEAEKRELARAAEEQITSFGGGSGAEEEPEQEFSVTTSKVRAVFTNRGGDLVSYQLLGHLDKATGHGVEMVDNVTQDNRALALAFGDASASIINQTFSVQRQGENVIVFYRNFENTGADGVPRRFRLVKRYEFKDDSYVFKFGVEVNMLDGGDGLDVNGAAYSLRTSPQIGPHYDQANRYDVRQFVALDGSKRIKKAFSGNKYSNRQWEWAGAAGKYFAILVKPVTPEVMSSSVRYTTDSETDYSNAQVFLTRNAIPAGEPAVTQDTYYVYIGPRSEGELTKFNSSNRNGWGLVNAKFNQALQTSGVFSLIEVALKWGLEMIYRLVHNWGVAIIILTIILKVILFPLNRSSAMGTLKMQALQPQLQAIQEKYKDDQARLSKEMGELYKKAGYNPASGCLPLILQMVILISLYNVFNNYFEFRGASFISGWIDDLSVGDSVWTWEAQIPLLSGFTQNTLRLLPFIYLVSQLLNGKITQYGGAGVGNAQSQGQMKFMMYGMPFLFFFMFYSVPSGLLLYWTVSNIFQMGQQLIINRVMRQKREELAKQAPAVVPPPHRNGRRSRGGKKKSR